MTTWLPKTMMSTHSKNTDLILRYIAKMRVVFKIPFNLNPKIPALVSPDTRISWQRPRWTWHTLLSRLSLKINHNFPSLSMLTISNRKSVCVLAALANKIGEIRKKDLVLWKQIRYLFKQQWIWMTLSQVSQVNCRAAVGEKGFRLRLVKSSLQSPTVWTQINNCQPQVLTLLFKESLNEHRDD